MAQTYISTDNSRGSAVTAANPSYAHIRGWNAGVRVDVVSPRGGPDMFDVYLTRGSNGGRSDVYLGRVQDTDDGPRWDASIEPLATPV